jgi:hypothetical protein
VTQNETIIKHLKKAKSISQREALADYSIQSLTKRISELRSMGYRIKTVHKLHPVTGQRYARYTMGR